MNRALGPASIAYYVLLAALSIDARAKAVAAPPITRTIYRGQCTDISCSFSSPPPLSFFFESEFRFEEGRLLLFIEEIDKFFFFIKILGVVR